MTKHFSIFFHGSSSCESAVSCELIIGRIFTTHPAVWTSFRKLCRIQQDIIWFINVHSHNAMHQWILICMLFFWRSEAAFQTKQSLRGWWLQQLLMQQTLLRVWVVVPASDSRIFIPHVVDFVVVEGSFCQDVVRRRFSSTVTHYTLLWGQPMIGLMSCSLNPT